MKLEHVNENTIKVMIGKSDLEERGLTFFDLLGNQGQAESFFYSILEEVGMKHEFEGIDAVTFQVVPKRDGLDLYITKGLKESLKDQIMNANSSQSNKQSDTPLDQIIEYLEKDNQIKQEKSKQSSDKKIISDFQTFVFDDFKNFIAFAHQINNDNIGENSLIYYDEQYYWGHKTSRPEFLDDVHYKAVNHGEVSFISFYVVKEHGQMIMENNAVEVTKKHFK